MHVHAPVESITRRFTRRSVSSHLALFTMCSTARFVTICLLIGYSAVDIARRIWVIYREFLFGKDEIEPFDKFGSRLLGGV